MRQRDFIAVIGFIAASSVASIPNPAESSAIKRSVSSVSSNCPPRVFSEKMGIDASSFLTSLRTALNTDDEPSPART